VRKWSVNHRSRFMEIRHEPAPHRATYTNMSHWAALLWKLFRSEIREIARLRSSRSTESSLNKHSLIFSLFKLFRMHETQQRPRNPNEVIFIFNKLHIIVVCIGFECQHGSKVAASAKGKRRTCACECVKRIRQTDAYFFFSNKRISVLRADSLTAAPCR